MSRETEPYRCVTDGCSAGDCPACRYVARLEGEWRALWEAVEKHRQWARRAMQSRAGTDWDAGYLTALEHACIELDCALPVRYFASAALPLGAASE